MLTTVMLRQKNKDTANSCILPYLHRINHPYYGTHTPILYNIVPVFQKPAWSSHLFWQSSPNNFSKCSFRCSQLPKTPQHSHSGRTRQVVQKYGNVWTLVMGAKINRMQSIILETAQKSIKMQLLQEVLFTDMHQERYADWRPNSDDLTVFRSCQ